MRQTYIFLFVLGVAGQLAAQSGCPGCAISLPDSLSMDTLFLGAAPDGVYQQYYEADLSFRMPITTTPVANQGIDIPAGLNINTIEVVDVRNLPPGLQWEASQTSFDLPDETDGCVRFCGVPLQTDSFFVEVIVRATISIFSAEASLFIPMYIAPASVTNDGFTLVNNIGCGSVTTTFENNVPSNGQEGITYTWDFGDGSFSNAENPNPMTYVNPGVYPITYEAIIDTTGYFLANVTVTETGCSDALGGAPDLKINVFDPDGELLYTSPIQDNASLPASFSTFIELGEGGYSVQVIDDDNGLGGADDDCGTVAFTRETPGTFTAGDLTLRLNIFHPVDTIRTTDTVRVFEQPVAPEFAPIGDTRICPEDSVALEVLNYAGGLFWTQDSLALGLPDTQTVYYTSTPGVYSVVYTSPDGCQSEAIAPAFELEDPPITVQLENFGNVVQVFNNEVPLTLTYGWELDGQPLEETALRFCATQSGRYTLVLTDIQTGCSSRSHIDVEFNPDLGCDVTSVEEQLSAAAWEVYPNPGQGPLYLRGEIAESTPLQLRLVNTVGQVVFQQAANANSGTWQTELALPALPAGSYVLMISNQHETVSLPIIR